jgi:PAS domain S-box-containing protein
MSELHNLSRQLQLAQDRLHQIQQQATASAEQNPLLTEAVSTFSSSLAALQVTLEELRPQNEKKITMRQALEEERQRYQNLFDFAPDPYLLTNERGVILVVNGAAESLLNVRRDFLVGKPVMIFLAAADRALLYTQLERIAPSIYPPDFTNQPSRFETFPPSNQVTLFLQNQKLTIQPRDQAACPVSLALSGEHNHQGKVVRLYWLFRDLREPQSTPAILHESEKPFYPSRVASQQINLVLIQDITQLKQSEADRQAEVAILESEQQFRHMANHAPVMIWVTDPLGYCTFLNQSWYNFSGQTEETGLGFGWLAAIHPDDREQTKAIFLKANDRQEPFRLEYRLRRCDGEYCWVMNTASPRFGTNGQFEGYIGSVLDISDRKQSELELREISTALSHALEGISRLDEQGHYTFVNEAYAHMVGYTSRELIGMNWQRTVDPRDLEHVITAYQQMRSQGKVELEARGLRQDGSVFHKHLFMVAVCNEQQQFIGHYCFMRDITDRKLTEQKIREQAALLDVTSDAIVVRDLNHRILYWNRGAEQLYGWSPAEAIGQSASELLEGDSQVADIIATLLNQGEWRGEMHRVTQAGRQVIVEASWTLVRDEASQPKCVLSVDKDITEKKQLEVQFYRTQRLESLGTLATGIAHDLNNVLTPIVAISQLLRSHQSTLDGRSLEMLKVLEESAKRGTNMVKQILTFTQGRGGERSPVQVALVLREVIQVILQTFPKSLIIHENIPTEFSSVVSADSTYLHQVFMNLSINARDAMPHGGTLSFSVEDCSVDQAVAQTNLDAQVGDYVVVTVADTGTGISPEVRDRIFDPFFTTKALGQGTGLGLATVLGIVKHYGGFLQVFSEVGHGTQVKVYLPHDKVT